MDSGLLTSLGLGMMADIYMMANSELRRSVTSIAPG